MASAARHSIRGSNGKFKSFVEKDPMQCISAAKMQGLQLYNSKSQLNLQEEEDEDNMPPSKRCTGARVSFILYREMRCLLLDIRKLCKEIKPTC